MRQHTTTGNGSLDEGVQLFITPDGQLQVAGSDTLDLAILGDVASQLKNLSSQILQNGSSVDCGSSTNALLGGGAVLQETVDTANRELKTSAGRPGLRGLLGGSLAGLSGLATLAALATFAAFTADARLEAIRIEEGKAMGNSVAGEEFELARGWNDR